MSGWRTQASRVQQQLGIAGSAEGAAEEEVEAPVLVHVRDLHLAGAHVAAALAPDHLGRVERVASEAPADDEAAPASDAHQVQQPVSVQVAPGSHGHDRGRPHLPGGFERPVPSPAQDQDSPGSRVPLERGKEQVVDAIAVDVQPQAARGAAVDSGLLEVRRREGAGREVRDRAGAHHPDQRSEQGPEEEVRERIRRAVVDLEEKRPWRILLYDRRDGADAEASRPVTEEGGQHDPRWNADDRGPKRLHRDVLVAVPVQVADAGSPHTTGRHGQFGDRELERPAALREHEP